jgi:hypothetical protein
VIVAKVARLEHVALTNRDLGCIVNGCPVDPIEKRSFERVAFTPEKNLGAWTSRRGAFDSSMPCASKGPTREGIEPRIVQLEARHGAAIAAVEAIGANAGVLR